MSGRRLRVLVFAYACEPGRGSEPGAGWGLSRALARFADPVVLVGAEHAAGLDSWRRAHPDDRARYVVIDEGPGPRWLRRNRVGYFLSYLRWARRAAALGRRLAAERPFDAVHHASYAAYWLPSPAADLGLPFVWGPVGGAVVTPVALWPVLGVRGVLTELTDYVAVRMLARLPATRRTWAAATICIAQNAATVGRLPTPLQARSVVLNHALFTDVPAPASQVARRDGDLLHVGALESRKGVALVLRALATTPEHVRLCLVGDGPDRRRLERLSRRLGVADRTEFLGRVTRDDVLAVAASARGMVFAGLREEGGLALAEALLLGTPVVVLAHGGAATIADAVTEPDRVRTVAPGGTSATARRLGAAMIALYDRPAPESTRSSLDKEAALLRFREAFSPGVDAQREGTKRGG